MTSPVSGDDGGDDDSSEPDKPEETAAEHIQKQLDEIRLEEERKKQEKEERLARIPFYKPASRAQILESTPYSDFFMVNVVRR